MERESRTGTAGKHDCGMDVDIHSCSPTDMTGLIASAPKSKAEIEHYNQVYPFLPGHFDDQDNTIIPNNLDNERIP